MALADGLLSSLTRIVERSASWIRPSDHGASPTLSRVPSLQDHLGRLRRMLPRIRAVLDDAEEMEIQDESVKLWLHEIKDVAYDADDVLDEYEYELLRAEVEATSFPRSQPEHIPEHGGDVVEVSSLGIPSSFSSSMDASFWGNIACRVEEITERFNEISKQRDALHLREGVGERRFETTEVRPPSTPLMDGPNMYGREGDIKELMSRIFSPSEHNPSVIAVVGMGGVGKTTLVQHIYNDQAVCEHFELRGWVCVSDDFEVPKLTKRIIEAITKERCDLTELSVIQEKLMKELSGRRFLLVLDDLWNRRTDLWLSLRAPLRYGSQGSVIITTTRSENVAKTTQTMPCLGIGCLPFDDCWAIFQEHAFGSQAPREDEDLLEVGREMVRKCKGLPLACTTIGGLLRYESDIDKWNAVLRSEIWDSDESSNRSTILPTLMLSYIHLPTNLKRCFAYCAVFPKDFSFTKEQLVRLWMAQGFIQFHSVRQFEETGTQYFDELLQRSFFQPNHEYSAEHEQGFVMHDLIHDLSVSVSAGECSVINNEETWRPSHESQFLRHTSFVPYGSDVTVIFQSLCDDGLSGLRSLLLLRRTDVWVKKEVVNQIPDAVMQKLVCLRALDLSYIRLSHLPDSIGNLKHLRYLDLSRTRLEVFPESLCQLYLMQTMDLSYARIHRLPYSISNLRQLRYLSLCHTGLRMLPISVGRLINLRTLDLAYTGIYSLPRSVGNLRHLIFLDLSGTEIRSFPELVCMLSNLRTLNLNNVSIDALPYSIGNMQNLRRLDLNETGIETLPESICNLRYLQMLNLSFSRLRKLPKSIGNLRRLSHLDLSNTYVERLPESICGISNLQSLLLKSCSELRRLPNQMGCLTSLQHLDFNAQHVYMPRGIGRLTNLRTLPVFNVGTGHGGCSIEELADLTELRGSLQISGLRYVEKPEHADMVNLRGKTQIDRLTLKWECAHREESASSSPSLSEDEESDVLEKLQPASGSRDRIASQAEQSDVLEKLQARNSSQRRIDSHAKHSDMLDKPRPHSHSCWGRIASQTEQSDVLEKLQPPRDLTVLEVRGYGGSVFPRWMEDPSFGRLVQLLLQGCANCRHLPALGQLPSLKLLAIIDAPAVKLLGPEFRFGKEGEGRRGTAFPSLEVMTVRGMSKWVKWGGVKKGDFPRLVSLEIIDCPALRGDLPNTRYSLPMLKVLRLSDCPRLVYVPLHNLPNLRTAVLEGCERLVDIDFGMLPSSPSSSTPSTTEVALGFLRVAGCPRARFKGHLLPQTLAYLHIKWDCHRLLGWSRGDGRAWFAWIPYSGPELGFQGSKVGVRYRETSESKAQKEGWHEQDQA